MRDVIKKKVLKLLHVGIIYPMPYSEWVSPIQVVPKKGGLTVVPNDKKRADRSTSPHRVEDVH
jgi:hypothetical protein